MKEQIRAELGNLYSHLGQALLRERELEKEIHARERLLYLLEEEEKRQAEEAAKEEEDA